MMMVRNVWGTTDELATTNQTNFMTSTNNRFFITGVQLEKGRNATDFEHRSYGEELSLCQRYYQKNILYGTVIIHLDTGTLISKVLVHAAVPL